jgi:hypothetical protein
MGGALLVGMAALAWVPGLSRVLDLGPLGFSALAGLLAAAAFFQAWLLVLRRT